MSHDLNWVKRRALRERMLSAGAPKVWEAARAALQDACDSYNEHYPVDPNRKEITFAFENEKRFQITRTLFANRVDRYTDTQSKVLISFNEDAPSIEVASDTAAFTCLIKADEKSAYAVHDNEPISADELSRLTLEPLFFPTAIRRKPVFIEPYREATTRGSARPDGWME